MPISIESFRGAYEGIDTNKLSQTALTIFDEAKTQVNVGRGKPLALSDLQQLPGGGDSRIMNNVYLRGQLLSSIRDTLMTLNEDGSKKEFKSDQAKTFFKAAEKRLFGALEANTKTGKSEFGVQTASADLDAKTVNDLLSDLDILMAIERTRQFSESPELKEHLDLVAKLMFADPAALGKAVGIPFASRVRQAAISDLKMVDGCLQFTITPQDKWVEPKIAFVRADGTISLYKTVDDEFKGILDSVKAGGFNLIGKSIPQSLRKDVTRLLTFAKEGYAPFDEDLRRLYGNERNENLAGSLNYPLLMMLPKACEKIRQIQNDGKPITLKTWWQALGLKGKVPDEKASQAEIGRALLTAVYKRAKTDFMRIMNLTKKEALYLEKSDPENDTKKLLQKFMTFLIPELPYDTTVKCLQGMKSGKLDLDENDLKFTVQTMDTITSKELDDEHLADDMTGVRAMGSSFEYKTTNGDSVIINAGKPEFKESNKAAIHRLHEKEKFSMEQIGLMIHSLNNSTQALQPAFGFLQDEHNCKIKIEAEGDKDAPRMKVTYTIPLVKKTNDGKAFLVSNKNLVHEVVFEQNGESSCKSLEIKEVPPDTLGREQPETLWTREEWVAGKMVNPLPKPIPNQTVQTSFSSLFESSSIYFDVEGNQVSERDFYSEKFVNNQWNPQIKIDDDEFEYDGLKYGPNAVKFGGVLNANLLQLALGRLYYGGIDCLRTGYANLDKQDGPKKDVSVEMHFKSDTKELTLVVKERDIKATFSAKVDFTKMFGKNTNSFVQPLNKKTSIVKIEKI